MPSLRYGPNDLRPRLREKGPSALSAQQNSLLNTLRLLPAHLPKSHERRAPKPLHVGRRISTIQGRRVGEWLGQHRSLLGERAIARARAIARRCVDLARRGGRRARYCSYAFSTMTRVPLESSFNSVPTVRTGDLRGGQLRRRDKLAAPESACLTNKRLLVESSLAHSHAAVAQPGRAAV